MAQEMIAVRAKPNRHFLGVPGGNVTGPKHAKDDSGYMFLPRADAERHIRQGRVEPVSADKAAKALRARLSAVEEGAAGMEPVHIPAHAVSADKHADLHEQFAPRPPDEKPSAEQVAAAAVRAASGKK